MHRHHFYITAIPTRRSAYVQLGIQIVMGHTCHSRISQGVHLNSSINSFSPVGVLTFIQEILALLKKEIPIKWVWGHPDLEVSRFIRVNMSTDIPFNDCKG